MVPPKTTINNPNVQADFERVLKKQNEMMGMFLKFDGGEVEFGSKAGSKTGSYEIKEDKLEIKFDGGKTKVPMTINPDGTITYMNFVFRKK